MNEFEGSSSKSSKWSDWDEENVFAKDSRLQKKYSQVKNTAYGYSYHKEKFEHDFWRNPKYTNEIGKKWDPEDDIPPRDTTYDTDPEDLIDDLRELHRYRQYKKSLEVDPHEGEIQTDDTKFLMKEIEENFQSAGIASTVLPPLKRIKPKQKDIRRGYYPNDTQDMIRNLLARDREGRCVFQFLCQRRKVGKVSRRGHRKIMGNFKIRLGEDTQVKFLEVDKLHHQLLMRVIEPGNVAGRKEYNWNEMVLFVGLFDHLPIAMDAGAFCARTSLKLFSLKEIREGMHIYDTSKKTLVQYMGNSLAGINPYLSGTTITAHVFTRAKDQTVRPHYWGEKWEFQGNTHGPLAHLCDGRSKYEKTQSRGYGIVYRGRIGKLELGEFHNHQTIMISVLLRGNPLTTYY